MRTSERGSAVAEFIFLVLPLIGVAGSTVGISWYSFAKAQLIQITSEAAMQLAQPDSTEEEVRQVAGTKIAQRLATSEFTLNSSVTEGIATVNIELRQLKLLAPFSLVFPELSVVSHAPTEV